MDMFTSYGHIGSQNKITDFFMILAWASPFNVNLKIDCRPIVSAVRLTDIACFRRFLSRLWDTLKQVPKFRELQVPNFQVPGTSSSEIPK